MGESDIDFIDHGIVYSFIVNTGTSSVSTVTVDVSPSSNQGGLTIITGTMNGSTDGSGIQFKMLDSGGSVVNVQYRTMNSATTGSDSSGNSSGCPMNYYSVGNSSAGTSASGERSNFMLFFINTDTRCFAYGTTHYISTSNTTHCNRYMARTASSVQIASLQFSRWNGGNFTAEFQVHRVGASL